MSITCTLDLGEEQIAETGWSEQIRKRERRSLTHHEARIFEQRTQPRRVLVGRLILQLLSSRNYKVHIVDLSDCCLQFLPPGFLHVALPVPLDGLQNTGDKLR